MFGSQRSHFIKVGALELEPPKGALKLLTAVLPHFMSDAQQLLFSFNNEADCHKRRRCCQSVICTKTSEVMQVEKCHHCIQLLCFDQQRTGRHFHFCLNSHSNVCDAAATLAPFFCPHSPSAHNTASAFDCGHICNQRFLFSRGNKLPASAAAIDWKVVRQPQTGNTNSQNRLR